MKVVGGLVVGALTLLISCGSDHFPSSSGLMADEKKETAKEQLLISMPEGLFENDGLLGLFKKNCGVLIERNAYDRLKITFFVNESKREERVLSDTLAGEINILNKYSSVIETASNELSDFGPDENGEYLGYFLRSRATINPNGILPYIPGVDLFASKKADIDVDFYLFFDENYMPIKFIEVETEVGKRIGSVVNSCNNLKEKETVRN